MAFHGCLKQLVNFGSGHPRLRLLEQHLSVVKKCLYVFSAFTSDKRDWTISHRGEVFTQVSHPPLGGHFAGHLIPLVDDEHTGFVVLFDVMCELFVNFTDCLGAVEE